MGSGSGELDGGAAGDWGLLFFSPLAVPIPEVVAWESGFSARIVNFTFVFAVFRRLINWQGVGVVTSFAHISHSVGCLFLFLFYIGV